MLWRPREAFRSFSSGGWGPWGATSGGAREALRCFSACSDQRRSLSSQASAVRGRASRAHSGCALLRLYLRGSVAVPGVRELLSSFSGLGAWVTPYSVGCACSCLPMPFGDSAWPLHQYDGAHLLCVIRRPGLPRPGAGVWRGDFWGAVSGADGAGHRPHLRDTSDADKSLVQAASAARSGCALCVPLPDCTWRSSSSSRTTGGV